MHHFATMFTNFHCGMPPPPPHPPKLDTHHLHLKNVPHKKVDLFSKLRSPWEA